jgi:hypothetical protein
MQWHGKPLSHVEITINQKAVEDFNMNLSYSQFHKVSNQQNKATVGGKSQAPVVTQYLNLAIKQEQLRKLQEQNRQLKENDG